MAVELAAAARAQDWTVDFARREGLDVFRRRGGQTRWEAPTLVIRRALALQLRFLKSSPPVQTTGGRVDEHGIT